jgi:hypothetical protein
LRALTSDEAKQALAAAGLEVYRALPDRILLAERVRMHLMDSGVSLFLCDGPRVEFAVRCQRSDFPAAPDAELFDRVRDAMQALTSEHGFRELATATAEQRDPMNDESILDVWYQLVYAKDAASADDLLSDLRWALSVPKCISDPE